MKVKLEEGVHPIAAVIAMILGALCGALFPAIGPIFAPVGDVFLGLLKMCALPIVVIMVLESFFHLTAKSERRSYILRAVLLYSLTSVACAALGVFLARFVAPWVVSDKDILAFVSKKLVHQSRILISPPEHLAEFFINLIPQNIFKALAEGQIFSCLIFFSLLGVALAKGSPGGRVDAAAAIRTLKESLLWILGRFVRFLPLGVFAIFTGTFSSLGENGPWVVGKLALLCLLPIAALLAFQLISLALLRPRKFWSTLSAMRLPMLIGFTTTSSIVALPSAMKCLTEKAQIDVWAAEVILPLGVTFNSQAVITFYSFIVTFCAGIYGINGGLGLSLLIGVASVVRGICGAGLPGLATLGTLPMLYGPLGIPIDPLIVFLMVLLPLLSPFITMVNLFGYGWSGVILERRQDLTKRS